MRVFLPMLTGAACAGAMGFAWYTQRSSKMGDTRMSERALRQRLEPFTSIYESMLMSEKEWLALATCCNGERFVDFHRYAGRQPSRPQRSDSMAAVLSTSEVLGSLIIAKLVSRDRLH
ncbi:hypothetical protein Tcan_02534 [Toxocara canis]|uniref:Uncharacterized protein n=1 Tax=Toxocara canis TaxID=6265 RepID=A0A0B2UPL8_TOXCA|nr:hypothetical protein Tcan_02534 [Toxocara canis]